MSFFISLDGFGEVGTERLFFNREFWYLSELIFRQIHILFLKIAAASVDLDTAVNNIVGESGNSELNLN